MFLSSPASTDTIFFTLLYLVEAGIPLINTGGLVIVTTYQTFYEVASQFLASFG